MKHPTSNIQHRTSNPGSRAVENGSAKRKFDLEDRLLGFASTMIDLSEGLPNTKAGCHVGGQMLRCGTAPYANHGEAESAESPNDFIHKLKICLKELRETRRWLRLVERKQWCRDKADIQCALGEVEELIRIFVASIRTAQRNRTHGEGRT
jgi:four helix bundle protein